MTTNFSLSILPLAILLLLFALPQASGAQTQTYPSTCPPEAQAVVNAVGGCASVDPKSFSAVYNKCCGSTPLTTGRTSGSAPAGAPQTGTGGYAVYLAIAAVLVIGYLIWRKEK